MPGVSRGLGVISGQTFKCVAMILKNPRGFGCSEGEHILLKCRLLKTRVIIENNIKSIIINKLVTLINVDVYVVYDRAYAKTRGDMEDYRTFD